MKFVSKAFILPAILLFVNSGFTKVDPPNYDFSLDTFMDFSTGTSIEEIRKKYGQETFVNSLDQTKIVKFYVSHIRYKFPIFVQIFGQQVIDFYAVLPSYFLHDVFHQSLINRIGKQDEYKKIEESAVYIWKDRNGTSHLYSGTCTITCFPLYYAQWPLNPPKEIAEFKPLIKQFIQLD